VRRIRLGEDGANLIGPTAIMLDDHIGHFRHISLSLSCSARGEVTAGPE
jgi:hypothetical protein